VRVLCLRTLLREYPNHASVVAPLLREAAKDADAEVRLEAATALGVEGVAVLHALVADASVEDDLAARAAASLGPRMDAGVARATLRQEMAASSARQRPATACACTTALGHHGDPQDEPLLLALAIEQRDEALRLAAVRALGQLGSANAVPSLADLASAGSPDLRRAAREAIATIQARLRGATPGQLSLDPSNAGQIALADDAAGRLSEAPPKDE
jgi:HEAT repeat protein